MARLTPVPVLELGWRASMFIAYGRLIVMLGVESVGQSCVIPAHGAKRTA